MEIQRIARRSGYTIGQLLINGIKVCDTLEDTDRGLRQDMTADELVGGVALQLWRAPHGLASPTQTGAGQDVFVVSQYDNTWA